MYCGIWWSAVPSTVDGWDSKPMRSIFRDDAILKVEPGSCFGVGGVLRIMKAMSLGSQILQHRDAQLLQRWWF